MIKQDTAEGNVILFLFCAIYIEVSLVLAYTNNNGSRRDAERFNISLIVSLLHLQDMKKRQANNAVVRQS